MPGKTDKLLALKNTNTRSRIFFCLLKPEFSWTSISRLNGFEGRRLTRIILNDEGVFNMKDCIVKTTRSL